MSVDSVLEAAEEYGERPNYTIPDRPTGLEASRQAAKAAESTPTVLKQLHKAATNEPGSGKRASKSSVKRRKRAVARIRRQLAREELRNNHPEKLRKKKTTRPTFGRGHRRCPNPPPIRYVPAEPERELEPA